ncbi:MAG TPA: hypothetical protein VK726_19205 [Acetobacteraceae bacterium]|nr:hypothetical protein [Acetobacteraceae bacterium]
MTGRDPPAVVIHSLADARRALAPGRPVTLLSGEGAALYAGCGWWQALLRIIRAEFPQVLIADLLDCGGASGQAVAALRIGLRHLVLHPDAPGHERVAVIVAGLGGVLLSERPQALDLADPASHHRLHDWVQARGGPDDRHDPLR